MSEVNSQTSVLPNAQSISTHPELTNTTNLRVRSAMRGFLGQLAEPFIDVLAKVKKTLGGTDDVNKNTLALVQEVMIVRGGIAANDGQFKQTGTGN